MVNKTDTNKARLSRHRHVHGKVTGTAERLRLNVFRSTKNIYAQIIDGIAGVTLAAVSMPDKEFTGNGGNKEAAEQVGELIAKRAAGKGVTKVIFDHGGRIFRGRIEELAEDTREDGLKS